MHSRGPVHNHYWSFAFSTLDQIDYTCYNSMNDIKYVPYHNESQCFYSYNIIEQFCKMEFSIGKDINVYISLVVPSVGYDKNGYGRDGRDPLGYDRSGYNQEGFNLTGYNRVGDYDGDISFTKQGYNSKGLNRYFFIFTFVKFKILFAILLYRAKIFPTY